MSDVDFKLFAAADRGVGRYVLSKTDQITRCGIVSNEAGDLCTMFRMSGLFDGTPLERPVTCQACEKPMDQCACPRGASGEVLLPKDQPVRVGCEKRGKGKTITFIAGLDPVASDLGSILGQLKTVCAAGGTIRKDRIEIQGDHRERVLDILRNLGYPAKMTGG